ncbi:hypothetical protein L2735_11670 [Shewanella olleyana]|uniref:hypothetical protein n=1 Tax=Shewanella olleyana TaxID=135626 RepID=UPI00200F3D8E|nr:hypothetical protein [Shewanella olleyana]MCL1067460.1 hypothetical protein [Shewanella olleyana]
MYSFRPITITDVSNALEAIRTIVRPDADNEGQSINSDSVYSYLLPTEQRLVDIAEDTVKSYICDSGDKVNNNAIAHMRRKGYDTILQLDQYDPYKLTGHVVVGEWVIDLSDRQ